MEEPTILIAFAAGLASFVSPCMLPVIPAFLAQFAGTSVGREGFERGGAVLGVALFVAGFSIVFAVLGVTLNAALSNVAAETMVWLSRAAGAVVILLGLHVAGLIRPSFMDREYRFPNASARRSGFFSPLLFGASFAVAWTPCVGPILGSTLALAAAQPASAFPLLMAYAVGLGVPFFVIALFPLRAFAFIKRHRRLAAASRAVFGVLLVFMGVLVFTNKLSLLANFPVLKEVLL